MPLWGLQAGVEFPWPFGLRMGYPGANSARSVTWGRKVLQLDDSWR